jgi:hypothetical protein
MANFSGAGGYIPLLALFGMIFSLPTILLLWTGLAVSLQKGYDGKYDYAILERRLKKIVLPICLIAIVPWSLLLLSQIFSYGGGWPWIPIILWIVFIQTIGIYMVLFYSAKHSGGKNHISKLRWFLITFAFAILWLIINAIGLIIIFAFLEVSL